MEQQNKPTVQQPSGIPLQDAREYAQGLVPMRSRQRSLGYGPFDILDAPQDMNTYLAGQLGRQVTAHFVAGENNIFEVQGILRKVGRNFMVIQEIETGDAITCDFYSVRFVRVHNRND